MAVLSSYTEVDIRCPLQLFANFEFLFYTQDIPSIVIFTTLAVLLLALLDPFVSELPTRLMQPPADTLATQPLIPHGLIRSPSYFHTTLITDLPQRADDMKKAS
jgi:hypothetical protein